MLIKTLMFDNTARAISSANKHIHPITSLILTFHRRQRLCRRGPKLHEDVSGETSSLFQLKRVQRSLHFNVSPFSFFRFRTEEIPFDKFSMAIVQQ